MERAYEPKTLQEAIVYFADPANCRQYLVAHRWPQGVICPRCSSNSVIFQEKYNRWQCGKKHPLRQFTSKTGTIFEDSPLGLDKWLLAMWQVVNSKNGVSSYEISRTIGVTQKSAWFMDRRIRVALGIATPNKMSGHVEADDTFIGGKVGNMHTGQRAARVAEIGGKDKTAVMSILERSKDGKPNRVRASVVSNRKKKTLQAGVRKHVEAGSSLYIDFLLSYDGLEADCARQVLAHAVEYVDGQVPTNSPEKFWSWLKRSSSGPYVSVVAFHLFWYLDEHGYQFNKRKMMDGKHFGVDGIVGKPLKFDQLTGRSLLGSCRTL
jgi:hypothetical protein